MLNTKIKFSLWFGVVVLAAFFVGYLAWTKTTFNWPFDDEFIPPPQSSQVKGWQTYRNEEYGFEVKYPGDWEFDRLGGKDFSLVNSLDSIFGAYGPANPIDVTVIENREHYNLEKWLDESLDSRTIVSRKDIVFGSLQAVQTNETGLIGLVVTYLSNSNYVIRFSTPDSSPYLNAYNQILSTFKFIEPSIKLYESQQECEQVTGMSCVYQTCDVETGQLPQDACPEMTGWARVPR